MITLYSLAVLAWTSGWISNPAGRWEKPLSQPVTRKPSLSISQLKYAKGGRWALAQSGGPNARAHIRLPVGRGRESIELRGLAQILTDFSFSCRLKRSQIRAKCPSRPPNEHYAISPWLSGGFWAFCFPERLLVRRWKPNDTVGGRCNNVLQITSAMQMSCFQWKCRVSCKVKSPWQTTINSFMLRPARHVHCVEREFSSNPHQSTST